MNMHDWNCAQIDEALSADNKYYFWLKNGRPHNDVDELLAHYVENGGAEGFRKQHRSEYVQLPLNLV